ncbi:MAG: eCIS core domain-containing protein [Acidimicrobiia bacterium]
MCQRRSWSGLRGIVEMQKQRASIDVAASGDSRRESDGPSVHTPETAARGGRKGRSPKVESPGRNRGTGCLIQRALTVGAAADLWEREADAIAADVMRRLAAGASTSERCEGAASQLQRRVGPPLERSSDPASADGGPVEAEQAAAIDRLRSGGTALPRGLRSDMESAFGADFRGVRIHEGADAARLNREFGARAFTTGPDIFFGRGAYRPSAEAGRLLLAHELTHVVQQGAAGTSEHGSGQASAQRCPDVVQRLVSTARFQTVTASPTRAQHPLLPTLDGLLTSYAAASGDPIPKRFKRLDRIEHAIYGYFDAAPAKGNNDPFKSKLYWLLDQVQREHQTLTALNTTGGGAVWTSDSPNATETGEVASTWGLLQSGQGRAIINNIYSSAIHFENHPEYKKDMLAAFARLLSRPAGRQVVFDAVGKVAANAPPSIQLGPQRRSQIDAGVPAETAPTDDQAKAAWDSLGRTWTPGTGAESSMKMDALSDTEWRVYDANQNEILAPAFIVLGHELIHATHNLTGTNRKAKAYAGPKANWWNAEEKQTIQQENQIRAEHGLNTARFEHTKTSNDERTATLSESTRQDIEVLRAESPFSLRDFVPATKTGLFDVDLDINTGVMTITMKINLQLISVSTPSKKDKLWTAKEAAKWVADFKTAITKQWENKFVFVLKRQPGQDADLTVTPRVRLDAGYTVIEEIDSTQDQAPTPKGQGVGVHASPHFSTSVYHGSPGGYQQASVAQNYNLRAGGPHLASAMAVASTKDARVMSDQIAAGTGAGESILFKDNVKFDKHNRAMMDFIQSEEKVALKRYMKNSAGILTVNMLAGAIDGPGQTSLREFSNLVKGTYPPLVLDYPLVIQGTKACVNRVKAFLKAENLPNRLKTSTRKGAGTVDIVIDPKYKVSTKDKVGRQITVNHEFGHMIGVPDDYVCLSATAKQKLQNYRFKDGGVDAKMAPEYTVPGPGPATPMLVTAQEEFIDLCERAGVPVPLSFGMKNNALMGSGDEMFAHHYATLWQALTDMVGHITPARWWKIQSV